MPKWCVTETKRDWNNNNNGLGNNLDRGRRKNKKKKGQKMFFVSTYFSITGIPMHVREKPVNS